MPVLKNAKWEQMAQGLARGLPIDEAYVAAGFKPGRANAWKLMREHPEIELRKLEIQRPQVEVLDITPGRIIKELENIAFSDIRNYMAWGTFQQAGQPGRDGRPGIVGVVHLSDKVIMKDTKALTDGQARAIQQVKHTKDGIVLTLHDKLGALRMLGEALGIFQARGAASRSDEPPPLANVLPPTIIIDFAGVVSPEPVMVVPDEASTIEGSMTEAAQ